MNLEQNIIIKAFCLITSGDDNLNPYHTYHPTPEP